MLNTIKRIKFIRGPETAADVSFDFACKSFTFTKNLHVPLYQVKVVTKKVFFALSMSCLYSYSNTQF